MNVLALCGTLLLTFVVQIKYGAGKYLHISDCEVVVNSVYPCIDEIPISKVSATLRNISETGEKALDGEVDLYEDISSDFTMSLRMDKWGIDDWEEHIYDTEGNFCTFIKTYAQKAWEKLRNVAEPSITEECEVPEGHYSLVGYQITPDAFDMPMGIFGIFRIKAKIYNTDGILFACYMADIQANRKS